MQCNIDAKGKAVRLIVGGVMVLISAIVALTWLLGSRETLWPLWIGVGLLAAGGVAVFEGWAGWCVVRAMGFRTRI